MHLSGLINDWELGTKAQQLWEEPRYGPHFARFIQASNSLEWRAETSLIRAIASDVRSSGPRKVALVAQYEPMLTVFKHYSENLVGIAARVFQTIHEAIAWLPVRLPEPWPPEERS